MQSLINTVHKIYTKAHNRVCTLVPTRAHPPGTKAWPSLGKGSDKGLPLLTNRNKGARNCFRVAKQGYLGIVSDEVLIRSDLSTGSAFANWLKVHEHERSNA